MSFLIISRLLKAVGQGMGERPNPLPERELLPPDLRADEAQKFETIFTRLKNHPEEFYMFGQVMDVVGDRMKRKVGLRSCDGTMFVTDYESDVRAGFIDPKIYAISESFSTQDIRVKKTCAQLINNARNVIHRQITEARLIEARREREPLALAAPVKADPSAEDLCTQILAMAEEEAPVTDALAAMQYGNTLCRTVSDASRRFLEATIGAHNTFKGTNAALQRLVAEIRQTAQGMDDNRGGKAVSFGAVQHQIASLRQKIMDAMETCLTNFRDGTNSVALFTACDTALTALRTKGAERLDAARQGREDWADDLEESLLTLGVAAISVMRYRDTARLAADAERASVHALKRLGNVLPTLEAQIVAALAVERQGMAAEMGQNAQALVGGGVALLGQARRRVKVAFIEAAEGLETVMAGLAQAQQATIQAALLGAEAPPPPSDRASSDPARPLVPR